MGYNANRVDFPFPLLSFFQTLHLESRPKSFFAPTDCSRHERRLRLLLPAFYTDKDVARRLNLSPSWVRGQRHKRAHGVAHIFNLEPRYIGTCARYVAAEVEAFVASIEQGGR